MTDCFVFARSVATRQSAVEKSRIQERYTHRARCPVYEKMAWHAKPLHSRLSEVQAFACGDAVCDPIDDLLEVGGGVDEVEPMAVDR